MLKEEYLQQLLNELYVNEVLEVYDYTASTFTSQSDVFKNTKLWADQLVRDKLAMYTDKEHNSLQISNYGKYWMMNGGYESFLKEGMTTRDHNKDEHKKLFHEKEKEELMEARVKLTHYRLLGFWLTLIISSIGFLLSLYNLYLIMNGKK